MTGSNPVLYRIIHESMYERGWIAFLLSVLLLASCTTAPALPTATPATTSTRLPTSTQTLPPTTTATTTLTPTLVPLPVGTQTIFEQADRELVGTLYGQGSIAILLANMSVGDERQWSPFVAAVDKQKFTTVTFHYRSINNAEQETGIVLQKLRESGYKRIICIGASLGVWSCGSIAHEPEIIGVVLISGALKDKLADVTYPKLFLAGALDSDAFFTQMNYEQASEPKKLVLFPDNSIHGTGLFSSKDSQQFLSLLIDFVNNLANP